MADLLDIRYQATPADELAVVATQLSGDEVTTDAIEDLIVALKRAGAISGDEMGSLLSRYLAGKRQEVLSGLPDNDALGSN